VDTSIGENARQESSMDKPRGTRRKRRSFTKEFKAEAARLCRVGDRSIAQVAKDLDLSENALRQWVKQAEVDEGNGPPEALTSEERKELTRLRRENRQLQMEREILKKAAAFFAKEST
jgi:transposase-like protein